MSTLNFLADAGSGAQAANPASVVLGWVFFGWFLFVFFFAGKRMGEKEQ